MTKIPILPTIALSALLLGCPGTLEPGFKPNVPTEENSISFAYLGTTTASTGEWGIRWGIDRAPALSAPTRIRFEGVGTLINLNTMQPMDLTQEYETAGGLYRPPADLATDEVTVKVGCEVYSPFTKRWERSQDFDIKVYRKTTPMVFRYGVAFPGDTDAATVKAGEIFYFGFQIAPRPLEDLQVQWSLIPPPGYAGEIGSLQVKPWFAGDAWRYDYTAPAQVSTPLDVLVRTTAYDHWTKQTRQIDFTLHLVP